MNRLNRAIGRAAERGDVDGVRQLLAAGADPESCTAYVGAPLARAGAAGRLNVIRVLLQAGVAIDGPGGSGSDFPHIRPPLFAAVESGQYRAIQLLLQAGADADAVDPTPYDELITCADDENEVVERFLEWSRQQDVRRGETALRLAVERDDLIALQMLADAGAALDARNYRGETALLLAVASGKWEMAVALLDRGATPYSGSVSGMTPLLAAVLAEPSCSSLLEVAPMNLANFETSRLQIAARLLNAGAIPDHVDEFGQTALSCAAGQNNIPLMRLLLERGADPNVPPGSLPAALEGAVHSGNAAAVEILVASGAALNLPRSDGETAWSLAIGRNADAIVGILEAAGAVPMARREAPLSGSDAVIPAQPICRDARRAAISCSGHPAAVCPEDEEEERRVRKHLAACPSCSLWSMEHTDCPRIRTAIRRVQGANQMEWKLHRRIALNVLEAAHLITCQPCQRYAHELHQDQPYAYEVLSVFQNREFHGPAPDELAAHSREVSPDEKTLGSLAPTSPCGDIQSESSQAEARWAPPGEQSALSEQSPVIALWRYCKSPQELKALQAAGFETIGEVTECTPQEFLNLETLGPRGERTLRYRLYQHGFALVDDDPSDMAGIVWLDDMDLSVRTLNVLSKAGLLTLNEVADHTEAELLQLRNFGARGLREIREMLLRYGLALRSDGPLFLKEK